MADIPQEAHAAIIAARRRLVEEGVIHMLGRTASGEAVYGLSRTPLSIRVSRWSRGVWLLPAWLLEYTFRSSAWTLAFLLGEPTLAATLATAAARLQKWRERWTPVRRRVWLSIKPEE